MIISLIVAAGQNNEIGRGGQLLCHLPADLRHFKSLTSGHPVVMGRKTFESLPNGALPNRRNIVISKNPDFHPNNVETFNSIDSALVRLCNETEVFIIGGAQIYNQTIAFADKIYLTRIYQSFSDADAFFPIINNEEWRETSRESFSANENNPVSFSFIEYEKASVLR